MRMRTNLLSAAVATGLTLGLGLAMASAATPAPDTMVLHGSANRQTFNVPVGTHIEFQFNDYPVGWTCTAFGVTGDSVNRVDRTYLAIHPGVSVVKFGCYPGSSKPGNPGLPMMVHYQVTVNVY